MTEPRCECAHTGLWFDPKTLKYRAHKPNECPNTDARLYRRQGTLVRVCASCRHPDDVAVCAEPA